MSEFTVRYHPDAEALVRNVVGDDPGATFIADSTVPRDPGYSVEYPEEVVEREPLDITGPVEAVNEALSAETLAVQPPEPQEAAESPTRVPLDFGAFESLGGFERVANHATDGNEAFRLKVQVACERRSSQGEPLTYFVTPLVMPQPDGSALQSFAITLSMPGPIIGQPLNMIAMTQDILATQEQVDQFIGQVVEALRGARSEVLSQAPQV